MTGGTYDTVHRWHVTLFLLYVIGQRGLDFQRLALRLEALSIQVQRLSRESDDTQLTRDNLSLLLQRYSTASAVLIYEQFNESTDAEYCIVHTVWWHVGFWSSFKQDQQGLAHLLEKELKKVSQRLDQLSHHYHHQSHTLSPHDDLKLHEGKAQTFITWNFPKMIWVVFIPFYCPGLI